MATIKRKVANQRQFGGFAPFGNVTVLTYSLKTNAAGAVIDSDSAEAVKEGDVIVLGPLPEGFRLDDAHLIINTALTASTTGKLGFAYADGVDSAEVPQDDDYFLPASTSLATAARIRASGTGNVTLPKAANLILTVGGADNAKEAAVTVLVQGELTGPK
ncbi:hypothetical protein [Acinetobacter thermotolerans]|uniref:hypothetical protein n=1 Tax=Acinetobacter thermotolerans TaxID=3151487 RepID=UPI00325C2664